MTPTIIPYPKFLTKPWRCLALRALPTVCMSLLSLPQRHCQQWTARCQCNGDGWLDGDATAMEQHGGKRRLFGNVTAMDGVMAIQLQWLSRWQSDGSERTTAMAMNARRQRQWMAWQWTAWRWTARQWTVRRLSNGRLDSNAAPMERPVSNGQLDGNGDEWLGYGQLSNDRRNSLVMGSLTATRWRWTS
jgi:hypothetical protein